LGGTAVPPLPPHALAAPQFIITLHKINNSNNRRINNSNNRRINNSNNRRINNSNNRRINNSK
jgi:hypothetical protein